MQRKLQCLTLACALTAGSAARAQDTPDETTPAPTEVAPEPAAPEAPSFSDLVKTGVEAYKAERYEKAIKAFEAAYTIRQDPNLQYNIGRSHERLGHLDEAIAAFETFLGLPGTRTASRTKALESISALKKERAARQAAVAPPPPLPQLPVTGPINDAQMQAPATKQSRGLEIGLLATGGVLVASGAVFAVLASGEQGNFDDATTAAERTDAADAGKRWALLADIGLFGGAALATAGLVTWLVRGDSDETQVALSPTPDGDGAVAAIAGRF